MWTLFFYPSGRDGKSHRSARNKHQTIRTRPGWDLEDGLPMPVVRDGRRGRLGPAVPQRRGVCWGRCESKSWRRFGQRSSFDCKGCLCDWVERKQLARSRKPDASTGSGCRRRDRVPKRPDGHRSAAAAGGWTSLLGTLNWEETILYLVGLGCKSEPVWSALEQDTESLLAAGVLLC